MEAQALSQLLMASSVFHVFHLRAVSHAEHVVLQDAYELATKHADAIAEQILAAAPTAMDSCFSLSVEFTNAPLYLDRLLSLLTGINNTSNPGLQNVVQDAITDFQRVKYQLSLC